MYCNLQNIDDGTIIATGITIRGRGVTCEQSNITLKYRNQKQVVPWENLSYRHGSKHVQSGMAMGWTHLSQVRSTLE